MYSNTLVYYSVAIETNGVALFSCLLQMRSSFNGNVIRLLGLCLGWNVRLIVSLPRHIAILRQEWFNGLSWNFVGMLGVTMPRMYQILVTNQLNLTN